MVSKLNPSAPGCLYRGFLQFSSGLRRAGFHLVGERRQRGADLLSDNQMDDVLVRRGAMLADMGTETGDHGAGYLVHVAPKGLMDLERYDFDFVRVEQFRRAAFVFILCQQGYVMRPDRSGARESSVPVRGE